MFAIRSLLLIAASIALAPTHGQGPNRFKYRWVWVMANLFKPEEADRVEGLIRRASAAGYNGIAFADTKLQSQVPPPDFYVKNVRAMLDVAKQNHIAVIPCVASFGYSNSMLFLDPSLVEGMPIKDAPFFVANGRAQLQKLGKNLLSNGGMESADGDKMSGFVYQDAPGSASFSDSQVFHSGSRSVRMENPGASTATNGNCRLVAEVAVAPWRQYHVSAWVKTQDFERPGNAHIAILDENGNSLCFQDEAFDRNQEWKQIHATFVSQRASKVRVYFGIWDGGKGKMWWDDASVEEVGLLNVVRRKGCPLVVRSEDGAVYDEGRDFEPVADPRFGNQPWPGEWEVFHDSPSIKLTAGSRIKDGQTLRVSFFAETSTGQGQSNICISDPKTDELTRAEIDRVDHLFDPPGFFLSYDEIRVMNWCDDCRKRNLTPGQMLADSLRKTTAMVATQKHGADVFVWSDMFDKYHNAHDKYYLVNGDLFNSFDGLSQSTVVVNWNSGDAKHSLPFFANLRCKQILAGYYDGPVDSIKTWLQQGQNVKGIVGVMYTTWQSNYADLEAFAKAAWGGK